MFASRRNAEAVADLQEVCRGILLRLEGVETIPRPTPDVTDVRERLGRVDDALSALLEGQNDLTTAHQELRDGHKDLILAVSEGIERTERAERRVKATVKRARRELSDRGLTDPGLEAEDAELSEVDAEPGGNGGVQPVRREVAPVAPAASSVRGVSIDVMRRYRGF